MSMQIYKQYICTQQIIFLHQEYVQTIVECTGSPLEFFLEGTRSRSGKSLPPKIGEIYVVVISCINFLYFTVNYLGG